MSGPFLVPIFRANAAMFLPTMFAAAIAVLPRRISAPDHLLSILHFVPLLVFP